MLRQTHAPPRLERKTLGPTAIDPSANFETHEAPQLQFQTYHRRATGATLPDILGELAAAVGRLRPDRRNPEQFFEDRSEIAGQLVALARRLV